MIWIIQFHSPQSKGWFTCVYLRKLKMNIFHTRGYIFNIDHLNLTLPVTNKAMPLQWSVINEWVIVLKPPTSRLVNKDTYNCEIRQTLNNCVVR